MAGGHESGGERPVAQGAVAPTAYDALRHDAMAHDPMAQDTVAQDTVAQDTVAQDTVAPLSDEAGGVFDAETTELIAQIRQLAAEDPQGVQQIIAEVLAALDRVTGTAGQE
jgi:hypothetical protein